MNEPPPYFEPIRQRAAERWRQLEADRELAGPWHQLFKQIQSPRHVVSELLQNADDAGAECAAVELDEGVFEFSHDGEDFQQEHFASLCRFGYSNKRTLHTIGFRGIGFKSTFSLGNEVRVLSPTLRVAFRRERFTEPVWLTGAESQDGLTSFQVRIDEPLREQEIRKNVGSWLDSPASLLFFRSLRRLRFNESEVEWRCSGEGPVPGSQWFSLGEDDPSPVLLVRSEPEPFPVDAVEEIEAERMVHEGERMELPPCTVEIVLGMVGKLFVILPTGVATKLPFACNAPFIQDPARDRIKDPAISPTNRWLLQRIGQLAAKAMLSWLGNAQMSLEERARAYDLFVRRGKFSDALDEACEEIVSVAFHKLLTDQPVLLTTKGDVVPSDECLGVPNWLLDVWDTAVISEQFDDRERSILSPKIGQKTRARLASAGYLAQIDHQFVLSRLCERSLPRPETWHHLLALWKNVAVEVRYACVNSQPLASNVRIVPVLGQKFLHSSPVVVRVGGAKLLQSQDDWGFLCRHLLLIDSDWRRFLKAEKEQGNLELAEALHKADDLMSWLWIQDKTPPGHLIALASQALSRDATTTSEEWIHLAQIAAKLKAKVADDFQFIILDSKRRYNTPAHPVIVDPSGELQDLLPTEWYRAHVLHGHYDTRLVACDADEWQQWIKSGQSGLQSFVPFAVETERYDTRRSLNEWLQARGHRLIGDFEGPYVTSNFIVNDWDFPKVIWRHWEGIAEGQQSLWSQIVKLIVQQPTLFWQRRLHSEVLQIATTGTRCSVSSCKPCSAWIHKLRSLPCLRDTWGNACQPAELLCRTAETESLLDVEPFVAKEMDTEALRPLLLALGVRDNPTGPEKLLDRLKALATVENPPLGEVEKWCHRLDRIATRCDTDQLAMLKTAFSEQPLIFTSDNSWAKSDEVYLTPGEEGLEVPVVHPNLAGLVLWQRVGIEQRPSVQRVLAWLKGLPSGEKLDSTTLKRVKSVLGRFPSGVWEHCRHWLNLESEWVPVGELRFHLSMRSLVAHSHLFPGVRQQVADFRDLPHDLLHQAPFCDLPSLGSAISERLQTDFGRTLPPKEVPWITALGRGLTRLRMEEEEETGRVRELGRRLVATRWVTASPLETTPYLDDTPAGTPREADVVWDGELLYVDDRPLAKLLLPIARELARPFGSRDFEQAFTACAERSADFVADYLDQNFDLESQGAVPTDETPAVDPEGDQPQAEGEGPAAVEPMMVGDSANGDGHAPWDEPAPSTETESEPTFPRLDGRVATERAPRETQRPLIERFALATGFTSQRMGRYYHPDGRWIERVSNEVFPWHMHSADGDLIRCFWTRDHCLDRGPLEITAEVWELSKKFPDLHSLVTLNRSGQPIELRGEDLRQMVANQVLRLCPATYRLVRES